MSDIREWKLVMAYKYPKCGKLVKDMMATCNHTCKGKEESKEKGW